jgi:hypothetical protein
MCYRSPWFPEVEGVALGVYEAVIVALSPFQMLQDKIRRCWHGEIASVFALLLHLELHLIILESGK